MPNIQDIRTYMKSWKKYTYKQGLDYCYAVEKGSQLYNVTIDVLQRQKLEQKFMDGNSVQQIPLKNEGKTDILYSEIFWELTQNFLTPASYVAAIVRKCIDINIIETDVVAGIVGRGLRALPSFLREMDLTYKMSKYFPNADMFNSPNQDVKEHTDVFVKSDKCEYRIWSYQNFERGLFNTAARIREKRGDIPKGIHVLCPIDIGNEMECEEVDGWYFYSERYVKYLCEMIVMEKPDDYSIIRDMNEKLIYSYLKKANILKK